MNRILIPVDGSSYTAIEIEVARKYAQSFGSHIILFHVIETPTFAPGDRTSLVIDQLDKAIATDLMPEVKKQLAELKRSVIDVDPHAEIVTVSGNPADKIVDYADNHDIDLIIMGSKGLGSSAIKRFLIGSVTQKVLCTVKKTSVLVVK